jgi:hypothetical protein
MEPRMTDLERILDDEVSQPVDPRVGAMAAAIAARHPGARSVLFYGSCLRDQKLDGLMLDFYLIVSDYRAAYGKRWLAVANRLIPPNVFPFAQGTLSAKYAVLSEADFARECGPEARSSSVFARFAQPVRLVWSIDKQARATAVSNLAAAIRTLYRLTHAALPPESRQDSLEVWRRAFAFTYAAELRAERASRPGSIVDADPGRYERLTAALDTGSSLGLAKAAPARWRQLQRKGKWLSVVRLAKASFTFAGGIDYLAWKINRHAGTQIEIAPWQRRWPLLAAVTLLPRLLARGAIR